MIFCLTNTERSSMIKVSNDTIMEGVNLADETKSRIESELEVKTYIQKLKFALDHGARINFQVRRLVDKKREESIQISIQSMHYFQMKILKMH